MTWADASVLLASIALVAWGLWLRHRTQVRAMELGYEEEDPRYKFPAAHGYQPLWYSKPQPGTTPPPPPPRMNK